MIQLHTEILKKGNKREFAIIPFKEKTISLDLVKREMGI